MLAFVNGPETADFSMCGTPSSKTINTVGSDTYTISTSPINGFGDDVTLGVSGQLPAGITAEFSSNLIPVGVGSSTLTVSVAPSAAAGTYSLIVTGTSGGVTHSVPVTVIVNAVPTFTMSAAPSSQTVTLGNSTTYTVSTSAFNGFSGSVTLNQSGLPSGATASFSPASITGAGSSTMTVATTSALPAGSYQISIAGTSGNLTQSTAVTLVTVASPAVCTAPGSLTFTQVNLGASSAAQSITLSNCGTAVLAITGISATGDFSQTNNCGTSVAVGGSCTISVTFAPTATGIRTGTLNVTDNAAGSPQSVNVSGTGTAPVAGVSPASLNFGSQNVGTSSGAQTVTLSNTGTGPLTISSVSTSGDFAQTNNCGTSVAAGGSCTISVTFAPTATGARTGTLTVTDDAAGSPQLVNLSGDGIPVISSLSATLGPSGLQITIAGSKFGASQGTSTVTFGGIVANATSWSDTSINATVPSGVPAGATNVVVTVNGAASNPATFTVLPSITSLSPSSGVVGTSVTVTG